jgi:serine protease Do
MIAGVGVVAAVAFFLSNVTNRPVHAAQAARAAQSRGTFSTPSQVDGASFAPALELGRAFALVASRVKPAVVSVYSEKLMKSRAGDGQAPSFGDGDDFLERFFGRGSQGPAPRQNPQEFGAPRRGMGSGMILDAAGHILTNNHVVSDVDELTVRTADDRKFEAEVLATDPRTDVAVIQIKGTVPSDLPTVELGDSDALEAGSLVLAVGAPFGLTQTVTQGIISATGRSNVGISDYEDFLQTDAAINPGNSGGPLIDMNGHVIGVTSAIATSVGQFGGVGFAIPSNMIREMLPTLVQGKSVTRGMIGVIVQDVDEELAKEFHADTTKGALVAQVNKSSPADKAGIKPGDVIVRVGGKDVANTADLRKRVSAITPGQRTDIELTRNGKRQTLAVEVAKLETDAKSRAERGESGGGSGRWGFGAEVLTPNLAQELGVDAESGLVITSIRPGSPASFAGLQRGDVVLEVDHKPVANADELGQAMSKAGDRVLLLVKRGGASVFVVLQAR